jgi:hypothetical protein
MPKKYQINEYSDNKNITTYYNVPPIAEALRAPATINLCTIITDTERRNLFTETCSDGG